jgi:tetratricopeptide (TPR) repeat protein
MPQFRFWLLASVCLIISGCQFPLFSEGIGLPWRRDVANSPPDGQPDHRRRTRDGTIQQVSAEVDATSNRQQRVFQLLSRGNQELSAGRLPDAKLYFGQVLDAAPTNFHAHHMLARIGDQTQDYEYAEGHYLAALSASPVDPNLLSDMGYSYLLQGEFGYANTYLRRAVTAKPDHVMARRNLAALAAYQGDQNTALAWLRQVGTEEQAQTTLRELVSNRPPRMNRRRDPRDELPPDATPAARELAERLRQAKEQSGRKKWKRAMAEWARNSRGSPRNVSGTSFQGFDSRGRLMGRGSSDAEMQSAMRALEEEYSQRLAELQRRSSIPPRDPNRYQSTWPQQGPPAWELSEQMQRQQMRLEAEAQIRARDDGQMQMVIPPPYQTQQFQTQQHQSQQFQSQPQGQYQDPRYDRDPRQYQDPRTVSVDGASIQHGLNPVPNPRQVELLSPPPDFEQAGQRTGNPAMRTRAEYADPRNPQGTWNPQSGAGPIWNPQTGTPSGANSGFASTGTSINNAEAARRAMALGMSAGPGSLVPFGASPQNAASAQPPNQQAPNQQSFNGAAPIQPGFQQGSLQQSVAQPGSAQPSAVNPHWTPGQEFTPPIGGEASFYRDWQRQQTDSPTWDHLTSQPITQHQHWSQATPVNEAYRNQGVMTSPTTRTGFGQAPFVSREQQQLRSTTPADQLGAPASNAPSGASGDLRSLHNRF